MWHIFLITSPTLIYFNAFYTLQVRNLEDQLESAQIELKKGKTDEMSLKRLVTAKHERLSTAEIRIKKKREDVEQYKHTVFE